MSENEKRLKVLLAEMERSMYPACRRDAYEVGAVLDVLLAEHRDEVWKLRKAIDWACNEGADKVAAAARYAALEEAAQLFYGEFAERIRALRSQPAQYIPVAKVREAATVMLKSWATMKGNRAHSDLSIFDHKTDAVHELCRVLGVPLDAEPDASAPESENCEGAPDCGWHNVGPCRVCKAKQGEPHKMSCRPENREAAKTFRGEDTGHE